VRWPHTAALPVLVFLALHAADATSTELAAALWPQLYPGRTTNRIYNVMSTVRGARTRPRADRRSCGPGTGTASTRSGSGWT
jgi:hypothetical protein